MCERHVLNSAPITTRESINKRKTRNRTRDPAVQYEIMIKWFENFMKSKSDGIRDVSDKDLGS